MDKEQFQSILKTASTIKEIENYVLDEKDVLNNGYRKYQKLVINIIHKCIAELNSKITVINSIYKVDSMYKNLEIHFIFTEKDFKILLTINDSENVNISIIPNPLEIKLYLEYENYEYISAIFNKQKNYNNIEYEKNNKKLKEETELDDLIEIINNIMENLQQNDYEIFQEFKHILLKIEKIFE